jgi:hypothetical protein
MSHDTKDVPFQQQFKLFAGFDWASDHHDVVAVDPDGQIVLEMTIEDTTEGWATLREKFAKHVGQDLSAVAVAVETCNGPAVERLLETGCGVYPLNPKAAQRYRERKSPMGSKCDRLDAWSFGDALRTDGHGWRRLQHRRHHLQTIPLSLTHLNPVSVHPLSSFRGKRTFLTS